MPIFDGPKGSPHGDQINFMIRLSPALWAYLKTHAFRRDVSEQELGRDIWRSWVRRATPVNDPVFELASIGYRLPDPPTEKYPGYVESLRFLPEHEIVVEGDAPPPRTKHEQWPQRA
jgi:hypothetical protein